MRTIGSVSSRGVDKPCTWIVNPLALLVTLTLSMAGAARAILMVWLRLLASRSTPTACSAKVSVMVPETLPVCSAICEDCVAFAGIVKLAVRPPVENWMV